MLISILHYYYIDIYTLYDINKVININTNIFVYYLSNIYNIKCKIFKEKSRI